MPSLLIRHLILLPHNYPFKPLRKENVTSFFWQKMCSLQKNISISLLNSGSQLDPAQLNPSFSHVFLKLKGNTIATKKLQISEHKKMKGTKCRIMSLAHKNPWNWGSIWLIWRSSHYSTMLLGPCLFPWVCYVSNKYPICSASWIRIKNVWCILAINWRIYKHRVVMNRFKFVMNHWK